MTDLEVSYEEARLRVALRVHRERTGEQGEPDPLDWLEADELLAEVASWKD